MLKVQDSSGSVQALKTTVSGGEHVPHHIVDASALPTGAATQVTVAAILADLQLKADKDESQPISATSLPLPTGAASQTTLAAILAELELKANVSEVQPVFMSGAGQESTLSAIRTLIQAQNGTVAPTIYCSSGNIASTSPVTIAPTAAATKRHKIVGLTLSNSSATGTWVKLASDGNLLFAAYVKDSAPFGQEFGTVNALRGALERSVTLECEAVAQVRAVVRYITE